MAANIELAQISQIRISDSGTEVIDIDNIVKEEHDTNMIEISRGEGQDDIPGGVSLVIFDLSSTNDYQKDDTGAFIKDYLEWQDANKERVVVFVVKNDDDDDTNDYSKIMGDVSEYHKRIFDTHALYFASVDVDSLMLYCFVKRDLGHEPRHRLLSADLQWLHDEKGNDRDDSSTCSGLIASLLSKKAAEEAGSSTEAIIKSISGLDKLYATHKVNMEFTWPANGALSGALLEKVESEVQKVRYQDFGWHGGFSLARILAQFAAEHELSVADFSANLSGGSTTKALLNGDLNLKSMDNLTYLTYCIVSAIHLQSFGALFTSQPHFFSKPMDELRYHENNSTFTHPTPDCWGARSPITDIILTERPAQIDRESLGKAIALINRLIKDNVLIPRVPHLDAFEYQFATSLAALDERLRAINGGQFTATFDPKTKKYRRFQLLIGMYTSGLAGGSTAYDEMRNQALMCFCAFLPMIEHKLRAEGKTNDDEIRAEAMSYACVSHGLDPKHMIAARYAMTFDKPKFTGTEAEKVVTELFSGDSKWPLTNALMRTRIFASIIVIGQVNELHKAEKVQSYGFPRSRAYV